MIVPQKISTLIQRLVRTIVNLLLTLYYLPVKLCRVIQRYQVSHLINHFLRRPFRKRIKQHRPHHHQSVHFLSHQTNNTLLIYPKSMKCQNKQPVWNDFFLRRRRLMIIIQPLIGNNYVKNSTDRVWTKRRPSCPRHCHENRFICKHQKCLS